MSVLWISHWGILSTQIQKTKKIDVPPCVEFLNQESMVFFVLDSEQTQTSMSNASLPELHLLTAIVFIHLPALIVKAEVAVQPQSTHTLTTEVISHYKADQSTKNRLFEVMNAVPFPHLYQLSESIFCAYGPPTSSIPIGFVHLTLANWKMDCS